MTLNGDKASSPNDFVMALYHECWDVIIDDLMKVFQDFHSSGTINQSTNTSFISLLSKKRQTSKISDFRLQVVLHEIILRE